MKHLVLTITSILFAQTALSEDSIYQVVSTSIPSNKMLCGEVIESPDGAILNKVNQTNMERHGAIYAGSSCNVQFVTQKRNDLTGKAFEIVMYNSEDKSIQEVRRHIIK